MKALEDSRGSVAVIYPLLSCLVLAARGDRPGRQETRRVGGGWRDGGMEGAWRGYHLHITGGGKHVQVAAEIICLDCCSYNKLYVLTSGCLNGGRKSPRAGQTDNDGCNMACEEIWWRREMTQNIFSAVVHQVTAVLFCDSSPRNPSII